MTSSHDQKVVKARVVLRSPDADLSERLTAHGVVLAVPYSQGERVLLDDIAVALSDVCKVLADKVPQ